MLRAVFKQSGISKKHGLAAVSAQQRSILPNTRATTLRYSIGTDQQHKNGGSSRQTSINVTAGGVVALVVGGTLAARFLYGQFFVGGAKRDGQDPLGNPCRDASRASVVLIQTTRAPVTVKQERIGSSTLQQVDAAAFDVFVVQQRALLQRESQRVRQEALQVLHEELQTIAADAKTRIVAFCDWYLGYPTTYKFLGIAAQSAALHAMTIQKQQTLAARVTQDVQDRIGQKYQAIVLRPAHTDPRIHRAVVRALQTAHLGYQKAVEKLESSVAAFVSQQAKPYYGQAPTPQDVVVDLDWKAQLQKVQHVPLVYEKTPTVSLVAAGAALGKLASTGAGVAATKALSAKLAAPFATKAASTALAGKAAAGATGGALLGGPLGAVAGAAVGVGIDLTLNAGVALIQRPALEQDIRQALEATIQEWEERLTPEVERAQSTWFDHATSILQPSANNKSLSATTTNPTSGQNETSRPTLNMHEIGEPPNAKKLVSTSKVESKTGETRGTGDE